MNKNLPKLTCECGSTSWQVYSMSIQCACCHMPVPSSIVMTADGIDVEAMNKAIRERERKDMETMEFWAGMED